jgi:hypothetical protein
MGVEKMDRKDEPGGQQGFIRMNNRGYIQYPPREKDAEEFGKPEH